MALPRLARLADRRPAGPEGRLLLRDLIEHATQPEFVHRHEWRIGDLVIWDNRTTMHRAPPFDAAKHRRELRRVTTLDIPGPALAGAPLAGRLASAGRTGQRRRAFPPGTRIGRRPDPRAP